MNFGKLLRAKKKIEIFLEIISILLLLQIENTEKHISLENLMSLIENAIQAFPQSAKLWLKKLQYHLGQHDPEKFKEIFTEAHKCLKDEHSQYMLWQFMLQSCVDLSVSEVSSRCLLNIVSSSW